MALKALEEAWRRSSDDYDPTIAAHYLARQQATEGERLRRNEDALRRARGLGDERVEPLFRSLLLNVEDSLEKTGRVAEAHVYDLHAVGQLEKLPREHVRVSLKAAVARTEWGFTAA